MNSILFLLGSSLLIKKSEESVGGILASRHEFKSLLLLKKDIVPMCGGLLISNASYILTSTTCPIDTPSDIEVYAGIHDSTTSTTYEITVQRRTLESRLDLNMPDPKIALYKLDEPFQKNEFIDSEEITTSLMFHRDMVLEGSGILPGWGHTQVTGGSNGNRKLRKVTTSIITPESDSNCIAPSNGFCGGNFTNGGAGGCGADTGGPLMCNNNNGDDPSLKFHQICGILVEGQCGAPRKYDIYADVNSYLSAIEEAINNNNDKNRK